MSKLTDILFPPNKSKVYMDMQEDLGMAILKRDQLQGAFDSLQAYTDNVVQSRDIYRSRLEELIKENQTLTVQIEMLTHQINILMENIMPKAEVTILEEQHEALSLETIDLSIKAITNLLEMVVAGMYSPPRKTTHTDYIATLAAGLGELNKYKHRVYGE